MKGAEFWVLDHEIGQPSFGRRKRPFRALLAARSPQFLESWPPKKPEVRLKKGRRFLSAGSLVSLISGAEGGLFGHLSLALLAPSQ